MKRSGSGRLKAWGQARVSRRRIACRTSRFVSACSVLLALNVAAEPRFTDVTRAAGIDFHHNAGKAGKKWLPETMGSGCAFTDLDGDGLPEILLINSRDWKPRGKKSTAALFKNNGNGTFINVTAASGLGFEQYGMGVTVGDFDNDGRPDLYLTALEGDRLMRNEGGLRFRDVTKAAGISNASFGTSAAWVDYDRDGLLDVYVANYVQWSAAGDRFCSLDGVAKSYCTPESYKGVTNRMFRNLGAGRFEDATKKARLFEAAGKSLGVAVLDYDNDGWPDLFVANDTQPNKLYRNQRNGTFRDVAVAAGVAYGEDGVARGAMGVDAGDYDRSGRAHLLVGNFSNQMLGLYRNQGGGLFVDEAPRTQVGRSSLLCLTFGVFFFDYDLDGWLDIFAANGHIEEEIARAQPKVRFAQAPLLLRNTGRGRFEDVSARLGPDLAAPMVARGAAYADYDGDGDLDVLLTANHGPARLLRNDAAPPGRRWLRLELEGTRSNRSGIGAVVRLLSAGGRQWTMVRSGSSYCSQSEFAVTFGLGSDADAAVEIEWPGGATQRAGRLSAGKSYRIVEGQAALATRVARQ